MPDTSGSDLITIKYPGQRCADCGNIIALGSHARMVQPTLPGRRPRITHNEGTGGCCNAGYTVKCVYGATSVTVKATGYSPREAVVQARKACAKRDTRMPAPSCYIVYQGNVPVLTAVR